MAATKSKKSAPTAQDLISAYMHAQLDGSKPCTNVYQFCQIAGCSEGDFYAQFSDLAHLKSSIWEAFMGQASDLVAQSPDFQQAPAQEKALSLLFTLFEVMTANRTYILHSAEAFKSDLASWGDLKGFRTQYKAWAKEHLSRTQQGPKALAQLQSAGTEEAFWIQFMLLFQYWVKDRSKGFEKTDILIEKSTATFFELFMDRPNSNLFDLGKYLIKDFIAH